jgi:general secretion pathway protein J
VTQRPSSRCALRIPEPRARLVRSGFTLLEVLIALAIMATLALTGYRALTGMLDGERRITADRDRWRDLDLFFSRFDYDLGHALPRPYTLGSTTFPGLFLRADGLALVRATPGEIPQRIGYRLHDGRIEVLYWRGLDAQVPPEPVAYTVATGVAAWELRLANREGEWLDRWGEPGPQDTEAPLPRGGHLALTLTDGTRIERVFAWR